MVALASSLEALCAAWTSREVDYMEGAARVDAGGAAAPEESAAGVRQHAAALGRIDSAGQLLKLARGVSKCPQRE